MNRAGLSFRAAVAADVATAVPLIHSSGPATFEYVFAVPGVGSALVDHRAGGPVRRFR